MIQPHGRGVFRSPEIAVILDSVWRDSGSFSLVDNKHQIINVFLPASGKPRIQVLSGHEGEVNSIAWTANQRILVSGGEDGLVKVGAIFGIPGSCGTRRRRAQCSSTAVIRGR